MEALQAVYGRIRAAGAELVVLSPQLRKYSRQMANKHGLGFPVLSDPGNRVAARFGVVFTLPPELQEVYAELGLDLPRFNGDDSWSLPLPGRFIVGRDGRIRDVEVHIDYTERPDPEETAARVERLPAP